MDILKSVETWLTEDYDLETRNEVRRLMSEDEEALNDAFYRTLEFGTGGLRGIMGVGPNRMNKYTVAAATQGLANYLKKQVTSAQLQVVVAYDSRHQSSYFAQITAEVMAANGIRCFLFEALRPTPELSFAVRHLHCHAGVMVTASHNPKEYNGYKVYWSDGGQIVPPHDKGIIEEVRAVTSVQQIQWSGNPALIESIGHSVDEAYLSQVLTLSLQPEAIQQKHDLKIVYTPLHGTGITMVPTALRAYGFTHVTLVEAQQEPNGDFPTVQSPNPEEASALAMAIETANQVGADLLLATDPDADRVGIAVRNDKGEMQLFNGNTTGALLIYYVLSQWAANQRLAGNEFVVKTIVTTELLKAIAQSFQTPCYDVLTGFKYIAEKIRTESTRTFIAGGEESYGYLVGDFVRDKDAVSACCMIAEMAAFFATQGKTLYSVLKELQLRYGVYREQLLSLTKKGQDGAAAIQKMMDTFRTTPPKVLGGSPVVKVIDYKLRVATAADGTTETIGLPQADVLQFFTADGSKVTVRPSGTEPKIKFYFEVHAPLNSLSELEVVKAQLDERIAAIRSACVE